MKRYLLNLLIALDQFANTVFLGDPDETISSRLGKYHPNSVLGKTVNTLFFWQKNHIAESIEADEGGNAIDK
jgi:hypothetical protein